MNILFVSHSFPPEVTAPALRLFQHGRHWVRAGASVDVITGVPHYPEGVLAKGYGNRLYHQVMDGIRVTRVPMYLAANRGRVRRILSYISFGLSSVVFSDRVRRKPDVVVATSPHFFSVLAGYVISRRYRVPFVFEVRDLWPESITAVGAMKQNFILDFVDWLVDQMYRRADRVVVLTEAFARAIEARGISREKMSLVMNGVDLELFGTPLDPVRLGELVHGYGLEGKFVASYVGTIGMAHRADILLEAAARCPDPDVVFLVMGAGAEREALRRRAEELALPNFRLVEKHPWEDVRYFLELSDVSVVHLRRTPVFEAVIPSKIFEAMASRRPLVLGVRGEAQRIVEEARAGLCVPPEDPQALLEAVLTLRKRPELCRQMAENGYRYVQEHHDRRKLAAVYLEILERLAGFSAAAVGSQG